MRATFPSLLLWTASAFLALAVPAGAALDAGTESALYLGAGARAVAMGRAGVTDDGKVFAADWNPAGLATVPRCVVGLQHAALFAGAIHDTAGFVYPDLELGTFGLTYTRLDLQGIDGRDANNLPTGDFGFTEQELAAAFGRHVWGPLSGGVVVKLHDLRLNGLESMAPGLDAGVLAAFPRPWADAGQDPVLQELRAGLFIRNLVGPVLRLDLDPERLEPAYRLGAGADLRLLEGLPNRLRLAVDLEKPERADIRLHAGAEFTCYEHFAVRGGWDQEYFSLGAGVNYLGLGLDYAVSFPVLGLRHLMTFTFAFGDDLAAVRAKRLNDAEQQRQQVIQNLKSEVTAGYLRQADQAQAGGDVRTAATLWEKVLLWEPENREAKTKLEAAQADLKQRQIATSLDLANRYFDAEQYLDAMLECRKVLELDPQNGQAMQINARSEKQASALGGAATTAEIQAVARTRELFLKGLKAYTHSNWTEAVQNWEQAAAQSPMQAQLTKYLAQAKERLAAAPGAAEGLAPAPETPKLYREAVDQSRSGKLTDAVQTWEKLIEKNPQDEDAKKNLEKTRKDLIDSQKRGLKW